jgi:hypothetical protein
MAAPAADDAPSTFTHRGWTFTHASTARIAAAPALDALSSALALGAVPLPEMTFAANFLEVRHAASGFAVRFDAAGALGAWHAAQVASSAVVAGAALPVDVTNYDCTYTTAYEGDGANQGIDAFEGLDAANQQHEWRRLGGETQGGAGFGHIVGVKTFEVHATRDDFDVIGSGFVMPDHLLQIKGGGSHHDISFAHQTPFEGDALAGFTLFVTTGHVVFHGAEGVEHVYQRDAPRLTECQPNNP